MQTKSFKHFNKHVECRTIILVLCNKIVPLTGNFDGIALVLARDGCSVKQNYHLTPTHMHFESKAYALGIKGICSGFGTWNQRHMHLDVL